MKKRNRVILLGLAFIILSAFVMPAYGADNVPRISVKELDDILDSPDLVLLDVRTDKDWGKTDSKVVGAVRVDPGDISSWAENYSKAQQIVLYCA
jgi:rhodanese-related sulfurtransferase